MDMVIGFHPESMWTNLELDERDPESVYPMVKCVGWSDNEDVWQLYEMLCIGHFVFEPAGI